MIRQTDYTSDIRKSHKVHCICLLESVTKYMHIQINTNKVLYIHNGNRSYNYEYEIIKHLVYNFNFYSCLQFSSTIVTHKK